MKVTLYASGIRSSLIVGLTCFLQFSNLSLFEVLGFGYFLYSLLAKKIDSKLIVIYKKYNLIIFYFLTVTILISSLINGTEYSSLIKGSISLFLVPSTILFGAKLLKNRAETVFAILIFSTLTVLSRDAEFVSFQDSFKFVFSRIIIYGSMLFLLYIEQFKNSRLERFTSIIISFVLALLGFWGNLRLLGLISLLSLCFFYYQKSNLFRSYLSQKILTNKILLAIFLPFFLLALSLVTSFVVINGLNIHPSFLMSPHLPKQLNKSLVVLE